MAVAADIPAEWLKKMTDKYLTEEEKKQIQSARRTGETTGDVERSAWRNRRAGIRAARKWIGTGGTSPFGNGGYNPEGIRIGWREHAPDAR